VRFPARGDVELTWTVPAGIGLLRAELDGGDGLPADDSAAYSLAQARPLRALLVSASPAALERALRAVPGLALQVAAPADYAPPAGPGFDLTIFDGTLPTSWPAGAVLAISPPAGAGPLLTVSGRTSGPDPAAADLRLGAGAALFDGVSLGSVDFGPVPEVAPPDWAQVALARGDQALILRGSVGSSEVAVWSFSLARSNLTTRLAFPLLLARTVRDLTPAALPPALLAGETLSLRPDPRADTLVLTAPDGSERRLALRRGEETQLELAGAGVYSLRELAGAAAVFAGQLPVNVGAARESDLAPRPLPASTSAPPAAAADPTRDQRPLWPWLAAAALAVMLGEWIYVHVRRRAALESV
jgi:hypothetical protein